MRLPRSRHVRSALKADKLAGVSLSPLSAIRVINAAQQISTGLHSYLGLWSARWPPVSRTVRRALARLARHGRVAAPSCASAWPRAQGRVRCPRSGAAVSESAWVKSWPRPASAARGAALKRGFGDALKTSQRKPGASSGLPDRCDSARASEWRYRPAEVQPAAAAL